MTLPGGILLAPDTTLATGWLEGLYWEHFCAVFFAGLLSADPVFGQNRNLKKTLSPASTANGVFSDDFSGGALSASWAAHPAFKIQSGQLVNTSSVDAWDHFLAIPKDINNPNFVKIVYGPSSDNVGRAFTGIAMLLDKADTTANGYLIFRNFNLVRLWTVVNGVPSQQVDAETAMQAEPDAGDTLMVEFTTDEAGHHFRVSIKGALDAVLDDPNKLRGMPSLHYGGVMINGNTNNGIDYFLSAQTIDTAPPGTVTTLQIASVSSSSITLKWQAPGDDGTLGTATSYDLRYSTSPIDNSNFAAAAQDTTVPQPSPAGTAELATVSGLSNGTTYYFALKTADEAGNVSSLSNVVSGSTPALNVAIDDFSRPGPGLGPNWEADPNLQIVSGRVQNLATADVWSFAVFNAIKSPSEISIMWGPNATTFGTNWFGILVMANSASPSPNGYLIQRYELGGVTRLWHIVDGQFAGTVEEGRSYGPAPKAGSVMRVEVSSDANGNYFTVFIDDQFDREFSDPQKLEGTTGPWFAGFVQESMLGEQNTIDEFTVKAPIRAPAQLLKISGDNQIGSIEKQLPEPLVVALVDSSGNAVPKASVNFKVTSGDAVLSNPLPSDNNLRFEAELAQLTGPMSAPADADASGGKYIVYPAGETADASATFTVNITQAGTYYLWTRSWKPGTDPGSWLVSVDGGSDFVYDVFQGWTSSGWEWDLLSERGTGGPSWPDFDPRVFNWNAGAHTVVFKARWAGTRLDKLLITADPNYVPNSKEEAGYTTDKDGYARANLTFGSTAGPVTVEASHGSLKATFTATATGGTASKIEMTSGNGQTGVAGQRLTQPFVVTVRDKGNNVVANYAMNWVVTKGNGKLSAYTSITDVKGQASTYLTLSNQSAENRVEARTPLTGAPIIFTATTTSGLAASTSIISGNSQSAVVRSTLPNPLVVKVADGSGNGVANYPIEFAVTRGGGSTTASNRVSNPGFEAVITGSSNPANWAPEGSPTSSEVQASTNAPFSGSRSLNVNASRSAIGVSQTINYLANTSYTLSFYAKVVTGTARIVWQTNQDEVIDLTNPSTNGAWQFFTFYATITTAGTRNLYFKTNGSGNFFIDEVKILPSTGINGQVSFNWTLGDTAGVQRGQAVVMNGTNHLSGSPLNFTATATSGLAALLQKASGDGQAGTAGQPLSAPFVAKVTDNTGINGVPNVNVTFEVKSGGGKLSGNVTSVIVKTDANGLASATLTLGSQTGVQNTVQASAEGVGNTVTFTATAAIPGQIIKVSGAPTVGSAGKKLTTPLTVRVTDNSANRLSGYPVTFTVKQGNGTINGAASAVIPTDANGEANAYPVLGPNPGATNRFEASVVYNDQHVQGSPVSFTVTAARLKNLSMVSGNNQTGTVGTSLPQPLKVKILDSLGAGIKNQNAIFKVTLGGGKLNGTDTLLTIKTDSLGIASVTWKLGPKPGTNNNKVQASTNPALTGSPQTFQASANAGSPQLLAKVSGDSLSGVVNNPLSKPMVVKVTDGSGNAKSGIDVIFTVKAGGGKINGATKDTVKTQSNGQASVILTLGSVSGAYNNIVEASASYNGKALTGSPITFIATAVSSNAWSMNIQSGGRQEGEVGQRLVNLLVVKVKDQPGNGVANHPVRFQITRGDGRLGGNAADTTVNTDATGLAKISWRLGPTTKPDSQLVQATANDGVNSLRGAPLKFVAFATAGRPNVDASFVQANPSTIPADGTTSCQITAYVRDLYGNPVSNVALTIFISGDGNSVKQPTDPTDVYGKVTGSFTTTRAETKIVTAKVIGGIDITRSATVQVTPLAPKTLIQVSGNSQTGNINTALLAPLVVKVGDKFGNGVPNQEVRFKVEQGGGKLLDPISLQLLDSLRINTDASGLVSVIYICGPTVMENRIRVSAQGLSNSPFLYLEQAVNSTAAKLEMVSGNLQQGTVGEILARPIVVRVVDSKSRPVFGIPVKYGITLGDGLINGLSNVTVTSDAFGEAKVSWRLGPEAGLNVLRSEASGLNGSPIDFEAQASPDRASALRVLNDIVYGNVNSQSEPITVRVVDALNNGVDGIGVIFELIEGSGALTDNFVVTSSGGYASVKVIFSSQSGPRKVRVSSEGLAYSPTTVTAFARALGASTIRVVDRTNNQGGTKSKTLNFPLAVKLLDGLGNPTPGVQVNFVVTRGGGSFAGLGSTYAISDSNGIASALWTLGSSAGANEAKAIKNGLAGSPIVFAATGYDNHFPIIEDVPDQRVIEGDFIRFTINATDADGDPLQYDARYNGSTTLPSGAAFDVLTRAFTWQTDLSSAGRHELSFFARDNKNGVDEEVVVIEVTDRNQMPVVMRRTPAGRGGGLPDTVIAKPGSGGSFPMRVVATDPDGDILSYRWFRDGVFTSTFTNTYEFTYGAVTQTTFSHVVVFIFDQQDTIRSDWLIQVPVELVSFSATVIENQRILLNWRTASEQDNIGFNILRSRTQSGKYEKTNSRLIPARRDGEYSFIDDNVEAGLRYYYKLESIDRNGQINVFGPIMIEVALPKTFELSQNYPNPFNPRTNIRFELPKSTFVTLAIYNTLGQEVRSLVHGHRTAGYHTVVWDGRDKDGRPAPSGIYHYRLQAGDYIATKKMVLAK